MLLQLLEPITLDDMPVLTNAECTMINQHCMLPWIGLPCCGYTTARYYIIYYTAWPEHKCIAVHTLLRSRSSLSRDLISILSVFSCSTLDILDRITSTCPRTQDLHVFSHICFSIREPETCSEWEMFVCARQYITQACLTTQK